MPWRTLGVVISAVLLLAAFTPALAQDMQKCFADLGYAKGDFPVTEKACAEVLALPIFAELTPDQQDYVVSCVAGFYGRS